MLRGALVNALSFILCFANIVGICCFQTTPSIVYGIAQLKGSPGINLVQVGLPEWGARKYYRRRYEAVAQELSSLDRVKNIYYIIGLNNTGQYKHPALLGFDLNNRGKLTVGTAPFFELSFVGVSQAVQVDPVTSNVILVGLDGTKKPPYHNVLLYDINKKKLEDIVHIPGSGIAVLGASSTIDDQGNGYFTFALNSSGRVSTSIFVVPTRGSKVGSYTQMPETTQDHLATMDFDMKTKKIYGVLGAERGKWGDWFLRCPQKEMVYKTYITRKHVGWWDCQCFSIQWQFQDIVLTTAARDTRESLFNLAPHAPQNARKIPCVVLIPKKARPVVLR